MNIDLFLFRHGETDKNVAHVWQGCHIDSVLNAKGEKQAEALAEKVSDLYMELYSSPLLRAVQTANKIAQKSIYQPQITIMQDLRECDYGVAEGLTLEEARKQYDSDFIDKLMWPDEKTADLHFPQGESKRSVFRRVLACLEQIVHDCSDVRRKHKAGIVCHAGVLSALEFGLGLKNVSYDNCSILHLRYDSCHFTQVFD